ncbi:hypothetical protein C9I94_05460 [Photobacterium swingsii]|uniref:Metallo-beta-lactamase domain-containing protein n=1 Tax=Photobacterium swingsii TaxID=680026 RepID=A0A2T3PAN9_9GAMM|nr:MBL fold metallo-hydrolase [Photobacterium swingsii]PSW26000.1 hypothetical protein C9I94_05460 [Photobacterium swingsii]
MVKIKMYPAKEGDAFLISFGNDNSTNIIIDMGLEETYQSFIKPDLIELKESGKKIDLLIVSHVDNDHICGAIEFIKENKDNNTVIQVGEVWHNSYRHLKFDKVDEVLEREEKLVLKQIREQNTPPSSTDGLSEIKIDEGITLAGLLYKYNYNWNVSLNEKAVLISEQELTISTNVRVKVISPSVNKLNSLAIKWKEKLESEKYGFILNNDIIFDDAYEQYMKHSNHSSEVNEIAKNEDKLTFYELKNKKGKDRSVTNGSSIAVILESEDVKLLFLADAHEDLIYEELKKLNDSGYELNFDFVKLSHHGSNNNISNRILSLISARKYMISTNGKYSHPDLATIAKIVDNDRHAKIITNYNHDKVLEFNNKYFDGIGEFTVTVLNELVFE